MITEDANLYGIREKIQWSEDQARTVLEKFAANLTDQLAKVAEKSDNVGVYVALSNDFKNLSLAETSQQLTIVGLSSVAFCIILAISRRASIFRAAVCGYFTGSIVVMYMVPYISSLLIVLSNTIEHKVKVVKCCLSEQLNRQVRR